MLIPLFTGCFAPINSTFESAKMLEKGGMEVQGSYSKYYGSSLDDESSNINNNYGLAVGYGISDQFSVKLRYERINILSSSTNIESTGGAWNIDLESDAYGIDYFELGNKFSLKKDHIAVSMPLGVYLFEGETLFSLDPRVFFTLGKSQTFEFNIIPKAHVFFGDEIEVTPGLSFGLGLRKDLSKWAIRPEIGFDFNFTVGLGVNYYFQPKKGGSGKK